MYVASLFDNGGPYYWRAIAGMPIILGTVLVLLDVVFIRKMNSLKFQVMMNGVDQTKQAAYKIYDKKTADDLCEDFDKILNPPDGDVQPLKKTFLQEIKANKRQFWHVILITFLVCYSYFTLYESFFVYIGSKDLNNTAEVEKSKFWAIFAVMSETIGYIINSTFDLGKDPRKLIIKTYWLAIVSALFVGTGYYLENLSWARLSSITHGFCLAGIYGAFNPYYLTVLPPALNGIPHIVLNFNNALINQLFPLYFTTDATYTRWAVGFGVIACFISFCWIMLILVLKSTKGLNNAQVIALFSRKKSRNSKHLAKSKSKSTPHLLE